LPLKACITGGIACGKSLLSFYLRELGVAVIDADDVAHEFLPDPAERRRIAREVFADPAKRKALEAELHPKIFAAIQAFHDRHQGQPAVAVIPLLFELGRERDYDFVCTVAATPEEQIKRLMSTRGYTREEALARIDAQLPVAEKAAKSDMVIRNSGSKADLAQAARTLAKRLGALI